MDEPTQGTGVPAGDPMTPPPADPMTPTTPTTPAAPMGEPGTDMGGDTTPPAQPGWTPPADDQNKGGTGEPPQGEAPMA